MKVAIESNSMQIHVYLFLHACYLCRNKRHVSWECENLSPPVFISRLNDSSLQEGNVREILHSCVHLEYLDLQNSVSKFSTSNLPVSHANRTWNFHRNSNIFFRKIYKMYVMFVDWFYFLINFLEGKKWIKHLKSVEFRT